MDVVMEESKKETTEVVDAPKTVMIDTSAAG